MSIITSLKNTKKYLCYENENNNKKELSRYVNVVTF